MASSVLLRIRFPVSKLLVFSTLVENSLNPVMLHSLQSFGKSWITMLRFSKVPFFRFTLIQVVKYLENINGIYHMTIFYFRSYSTITFSAQQIGYVAAFVPESRKAKEAGGRIFSIIHRKPQLQPNDGDFPTQQFKGSVSFNNVHFRYPTRKKIKILRVEPCFSC